MINAISLYDLIFNNHKGTNEKSTRTSIYEIKWYKGNPLIFCFLAKSTENYSSPKGHIVVIKFFENKQQMLVKDCKVVCTCPAYIYWGSKYNATQGEYFYKSYTNIPPDIRDPNRERLICKHIVAVRPYLKNLTKTTVHKKYKETFDKIPSVSTKMYKIKSSAEAQSIAFDSPEVIEALQDFIPFENALDIVGNDKVFESAINQMVEKGI